VTTPTTSTRTDPSPAPSSLSPAEREVALDLCAFIDASPSPHHAAAEARRRLESSGFAPLDEREAWALAPGDRRWVRRGGTIVAFVVGDEHPARAGFRMIGAHTDSPNLRAKPAGGRVQKGYAQVGVEVYGAPLLSTWMDRDLSLAGLVTLARGPGHVESKLVALRRPMARVANVAIHLNRGVNKDGLVLNEQRHMVPIVGLGDDADLAKLVATELGEDPGDVLGWELGFHDTLPSALGGLAEEFVFAPRLDNLGSSHAALRALSESAAARTRATRLVVLYDHEECGSRSATGAAGTVLADVTSRIVEAVGDREPQAVARAMSTSLLVSADMAHAIHPNYPDQHEPQHAPELGRGLVVKSNVNQSYATNGETAALFTTFCREAGFSPQHFVTRTDLPCGSTIGPITAARLGVATVDVGAPMLSMHSCREMAGSRDVALAIAAYRAALTVEG
jgi:aspartyl aminopeptidase